MTIQEEPEEIDSSALRSTLIPGSPSLLGSHSPRLHRASMSGKKLSGRPSFNKDSSIFSLSHQISTFSLDSADGDRDGPENRAEDPGALLSQVVMWLHEEKAKRSLHRSKSAADAAEGDAERSTTPGQPPPGSEVQISDDALALDKLERILAGFMVSGSNNGAGLGHRGSVTGRRKSSTAKKLKRGLAAASSDTEYQDGDLLVPNVEAVLDNSKITNNPAAQTDGDLTTLRPKDKDQWIAFKCEVVRLTHTLKLKGWRRVPMERGDDIDVRRLSGALTNAVYVVSPPNNLPELAATSDSATASLAPAPRRRPPAKLLLRIYGPQVEHLIDREGELSILRRLARKRIGPRLLGTFSNGRFEEFFNAHTLTPEDLRVPETSKQIAKRMRELHDGVELLEEERDAGPFVWRNWDKWVNRCEQVITWLDRQIVLQQKTGIQPKATKRWMQRGFVCGVEWPFFRRTVERCRKQIEKSHGGKSAIREQLVFAHNDVSPLKHVSLETDTYVPFQTQYGNLLRIQPSGESPLLHPANEHRQLVVIDFEYANANTPGLEFANHFTEWCYNYHHPEASYACNTKAYPTPEEQHRFVRSYVMHRPQFNPAASATPKMTPKEANVSTFTLDARTPQGDNKVDYFAEEKAREEAMEKQIQTLLRETKVWRIANSAQWVAWGIVQAKVSGLDEVLKPCKTAAISDQTQQRIHSQPDPLGPEVKVMQDDARAARPENRLQEEAHQEGSGEDEDHDEFDYLAYAQDRAMFFWGDCLQFGLVEAEELPESLRRRLKIVKY